MKDILQYIFEASGKPSDLKKYKRTERKETVHFRSGDMYDFSDPGYDDEFSYFDGSGNGYIKDKEGHVYDVVARDSQGDAGAIAGGSHDYYVTIKKANGKDDFCVHGYIGIMSSGSNTGCISDIKAGHYLEDYIAKYYNKWDHGDKFKELAERGNKDAASYEKEKADKKQAKNDEFDARYLKLPEKIYWEVNKDGFEIIQWHPGKDEKEVNDKRKERDKFSYNTPEWKEFNEQVLAAQKKADEITFSIFKQILIDKIQEIFKTKDINTLQGVSGAFSVPSDYTSKWGKFKNYGHLTLAVDTKKKQLVTIHDGDRKVLDEKLEMKVCDNVTIDKRKMNEKTEKLFKTVAKKWKKTEGRKQTEYISNNWERIQKEAGGYWKWNKSVSQAKADAKQEFLNYVKQHDWDKNDRLTFSLGLIQLYVEGDMDPEDKPIEKPLENPDPQGNASDNGGEENKEEKKQRGKDTKMSKGANVAAYDKMKAWHEGTRKQNVANCSDAKLKMNYKVCKELGYDKEMSQIEAEAKKRNLTLESINMQDYIDFINESETTEK